MLMQSLSKVRDWPGLWAWVRENNVPVEERGRHRALLVNGQKVIVSRTPGTDRRGALNARSDIRKALAA